MTKTTRRAFFSSIVALIICLTMLIGTTFAWFTDTASTAVNTIKSGTLDVELQMKKDGEWADAEGETLNFVAKDNREEILWEPGCTYDLEELRVINNGNLALKYKIVITGIGGDAELNDVIDWTIKVGETDYSVNSEFHLTAGESNSLSISGHMQETAGNEYQGKTIKNIAITVSATQDTVEYDSEDNMYDEDATYYINNSGKKIGTTYNASNVVLDPYKVVHVFDGNVSDGMVFYLKNGAELVVDNMDFSTTVKDDSGKRNIGFYLYSGSKLTINGGNFVMDGKWDAFIWAQGGTNGERCTVTINGGNFTLYGENNSTIVNAYSYHSSGVNYCGSDVYITGGFFDLSDANPNVTLQWKNDCSMVVTGGTFVNYNPADHGAVPEGYKSVAEPQSNGTTWYTVVAE